MGNKDIGGHVGTNEEYDPETDSWTPKASMPTPRILFATAVYQNKIYCIGGKTGNGYTEVNEVYNPATNTWETMAPLPEATGWLRANVIGGKIYAIDYRGINYLYDPEINSWTIKASAPDPPSVNHASVAFGNKLHLIGGFSSDSYYNLNQIYDAQADQWSYGAIPPSSHSGGDACATTGKNSSKLTYVLGNPGNLRPGEEQSFVRFYKLFFVFVCDMSLSLYVYV